MHGQAPTHSSCGTPACCFPGLWVAHPSPVIQWPSTCERTVGTLHFTNTTRCIHLSSVSPACGEPIWSSNRPLTNPPTPPPSPPRLLTPYSTGQSSTGARPCLAYHKRCCQQHTPASRVSDPFHHSALLTLTWHNTEGVCLYSGKEAARSDCEALSLFCSPSLFPRCPDSVAAKRRCLRQHVTNPSQVLKYIEERRWISWMRTITQ